MSEHPDRSTSRRQAEAGWSRASRCQSGECFELRVDGDFLLLRESGDPDRVLRGTLASWRAFAEAIKAGEFDYLG